MGNSSRLVVADRYLLDSQLLGACLSTGTEVEAVTTDALASTPLTEDDFVLLDAECDAPTIDQACREASSVGLLYDYPTRQVRQRAEHVAVRFAISRTVEVGDAAELVQRAMTGVAPRLTIPRSREAPEDVPSLSDRESEVLRLMAQGFANRDIARSLDISPHTVRTHVQTVLTKLNKRNRVAAVGAARQAGLLAR